MGVIVACREVGSYRGAIAMYGTTHKTVKRIERRSWSASTSTRPQPVPHGFAPAPAPTAPIPPTMSKPAGVRPSTARRTAHYSLG